jgi:hypothetical protein
VTQLLCGPRVLLLANYRRKRVSTQEEFLSFAETCRRLAAGGDVAAHRTALERMAQAWLNLAAEEERIALLVREVDDLFATPDSMDRLMRRAASTSH